MLCSDKSVFLTHEAAVTSSDEICLRLISILCCEMLQFEKSSQTPSGFETINLMLKSDWMLVLVRRQSFDLKIVPDNLVSQNSFNLETFESCYI